MSKPKGAFYWCAGCGGCEQAVLDLAEELLPVLEAIDFVFFPAIMDFKRKDAEALGEGELAVCFINGAVRSSEQREMAELLRRKSRIVVAFGSCAHQGGIPGLANLFDMASILRCVYLESPSTDNPEGIRPMAQSQTGEGGLTLPTLDESVRCLDQVIDVDYYVPGCPPPVGLVKEAVKTLLSGPLPPKGAVLAPDVALCRECPRIDSKPDTVWITGFKRPQQMEIDPERCLAAQGLVCMGPATRSGCGAACIKGNMPCSGCLGPVSRMRDQGAAGMSVWASLMDADDPDQVGRILDGIVDPAGTFYRYGLPASILFRRQGRSNGGHP